MDGHRGTNKAAWVFMFLAIHKFYQVSLRNGSIFLMDFHHSLLAIVAPLPFAAQLKSKGMCWSPFAVTWIRQSWCFVSG